MKNFFKLYRVEQKLFFRSPDVFIFLLCMPVVVLIIIGLLVAAVCKTTKSMNVATSLLYFPMLLFSGAMIPYELFPKGMQLVAGYMPLGVGIRLMKAASLGTSLGTMGTEIAILGLIAVVCIAISIKTFRWE